MKMYNRDSTLPMQPVTESKTAVLDQDFDLDVYEPESTWSPKFDEYWCIALKVLDAKVQIFLNLTTTGMRLGRSSTPHKGEPTFIDLSAYNAQKYGVSRVHAELSLKNGQVCIIDNASTNATLLNGKRLISHNRYNLKPGDIITLGKLEIEYQLLFDPFKIHKNR